MVSLDWKSRTLGDGGVVYTAALSHAIWQIHPSTKGGFELAYGESNPRYNFAPPHEIGNFMSQAEAMIMVETWENAPTALPVAQQMAAAGFVEDNRHVMVAEFNDFGVLLTSDKNGVFLEQETDDECRPLASMFAPQEQYGPLRPGTTSSRSVAAGDMQGLLAILDFRCSRLFTDFGNPAQISDLDAWRTSKGYVGDESHKPGL